MTEHRDLDPSALTRLNRLGGPAFLKNMIDLFLREAPERLAAARKGEQAGDWEAVATATHSIKSSAMNFGAVSLNVIAEKIEMAAHASDLENLPAMLDDLEQTYATVRAWLEKQKTEFET